MTPNATKKCPFCLEAIPFSATVCTVCRTDLAHPHGGGGGPGQRRGPGKQPTQILLSVVAVIVCVLGVGMFYMSRAKARTKYCYANMRVMLGAVEMYNMDNKDMIDTLAEEDLQRLQASKCLREIPVCAEPNNHYIGTKLSTTSKIECVGGELAHGSLY